MVDLALKNLLHDRLRFAMTVSAMAFAVTLILVQSGLFLGILGNASITIDRSSADIWVTGREACNVDFAHSFPESLVDRVRSVPGVARADNLVVVILEIALPGGRQEGAMVYALDDFRHWRLPWEVLEGDLADLRRGPYLFVDDSAQKRYGRFSLGEYRELQGKRLQIIGRSRGARSFTTTPVVCVDRALIQALLPEKLGGRTSYILVKTEPGADVSEVRREIQRRLPHNEVLLRDEWSERSRAYWIQSTGIGFNMALTIFLGCLVGTAIVAQTLYASTMEHLKEYGTVKAIGGSNRDIYLIIGRQALIAALMGFVAGLATSCAAQPLVRHLDLEIQLPAWLVGTTFLGTLGMAVCGSLISFRKVAELDPVLVFRM